MATSVRLFTGAEMPTIGLGTWQSPPGAVRDAVISAIEAGYRHVDCAAFYGNENEVGAGLEDVISRGIVRRSDIFVTSKLWSMSAHPVSPCGATGSPLCVTPTFTQDEVAAALDKTLADLRTPYVDLYLIHWPFFIAKGAPTFPPPEEFRLGYTPEQYLAVWRELEKAVDAGKARHIGTSNMSARKLEALLASARVRPAANQIELHPALGQQRLVHWCLRRGIAVTAYCPLGSPDRPPRMITDSDPSLLTDAAVVGIAAAHGVSPGQVLLRWAIQRGTIAIPKSVTPARIAQNLDVFSWSLAPAEVEALGRLDVNHRFVKGQPSTVGSQTWESLWDEDFDYAASDAALEAAAQAK